MLLVRVHVTCSCPCYLFVSMLLVRVHVTCSCSCYLFVSMFCFSTKTSLVAGVGNMSLTKASSVHGTALPTLLAVIGSVVTRS